MYSKKIYESWKAKQLQKYADVVPRIFDFLSNDMSVIDIGIGPGWLEEILMELGLKFQKIVGIDTDEKMVEPKKEYIEYHITEHFGSAEKFELLICFDTLHLINKPEKILDYLKPGGFALISLPLKYKEKLKVFEKHNILEFGNIGEEEVDYFIFLEK